MAVLEEFKMQLVKDLARYMIEKNEPRDQMWKRLKIEYGWDCKLMWERIRSLTMKKLSKMLAAEDRTDSIPSIARMTPNDWLVFDKILVHENIDVIGEDLILSGQPESKVLWELFILVSSYHIETLPPGDVAKGWYNLTKIYNTSGRYCSAMLLQLRWYQLKVLVRTNFHSFWSIYQGHGNYMKQVPRASKLQKLIASRYGKILTEPFLPWKVLIIKKVVVQENFSLLDQSKTSNDDEDIIEIKPSIETIDLNTDSESDDESNIKKSQVTNTQEKQYISGINDISQLAVEKSSVNDLNYQEDKDTLKSTSSTVLPKIINVEGNFNAKKSQFSVDLTEQHHDVIRKDVIKYVDERKTVEKIKFTDDKLLQCKNIESGNQVTENGVQITIVEHVNNCVEENDSAQSIDPKLLMIPLSYTKKLDHMSVFKNINYLKIKGKHIIKCVENESKPIIMIKSIKKGRIKEAVTSNYPKKCPIPQINNTRNMRQNLKKRTYSLKQLQKNPDFNAQLKNLHINFFLNERNRRLLFNCKPVTIDLDRLNEPKLHINNSNFENTSSIIKQENERYECENTISHVSSTDNVLYKSLEDVKEFLPIQNKIDKSETSLNSTGIDGSGKNFLAIEVSPLFSNNSTTTPPVKLVRFDTDSPNQVNTKTSPTKQIDVVQTRHQIIHLVKTVTSKRIL
ncbi:uncharacterized protein LOC106718644 [Papilio machaon]|uniref:uncharacterized protein LOC106718644 n=1 Tax=Papilio machaon TaxID=76193 RepID=UPI001E6646EB|nr:uncharacterized protein LOC106718644 [Papilio machaon]